MTSTRLFFLFLILATPLLAQNTNDYMGPRAPIPGNPQLVRIQLMVHDDPNPQGVKIVSVRLHHHDMTLKPSDIYGFRGQTSYQVRPGKYTLRWVVRRDPHIWPRTITHEEEVDVSPKDFWIQINITGDKAAIS